MQTESSITKLDNYIGQKIQVIAFGTSYVGILKTINYETGVLILEGNQDTVTIDLERVESFVSAEN